MKRERVFQRDGYHCVYCGEPGTAEELTLDHVEPRLRGGDQSEGNLVTCCRACNTLKGSEPAWSYLQRNASARSHFLAAVAAPREATVQPVWPRLIRAIEEAAQRDARPRSRSKRE